MNSLYHFHEMRGILGVIFDNSQQTGSDNKRRLSPFTILWMSIYAKG